MHRIVACLALLLVAGIVACRDLNAPVVPCSGSIAVTVTSGTQPNFIWFPACGISQVTVTTVPAISTDAERVVWGFTVLEPELIVPTVVYGSSPPNAVVSKVSETLTAGATYRVSVVFTNASDVVLGGGSATFVWFPPG